MYLAHARHTRGRGSTAVPQLIRLARGSIVRTHHTCVRCQAEPGAEPGEAGSVAESMIRWLVRTDQMNVWIEHLWSWGSGSVGMAETPSGKRPDKVGVGRARALCLELRYVCPEGGSVHQCSSYCSRVDGDLTTPE